MLMNHYVHEGMIGTCTAAGGPHFHKGNETIMAALSRRPFDEKAWSAADWPAIKAVYDSVRSAYNQWSIDRDGKMAGYENDAFHEGNQFLYLSSWASLCGKHGEALGYLDSLENLYRAVKTTCIRRGIVGKTRLCKVCGYDAADAANWFDLQMFYLSIRRAMLNLRGGDAAKADSCYAAAMRTRRRRSC